MTEACVIVDFHLKLQKAIPGTYLLWWPSSGDTKYSHSIKLIDTRAAVDTIIHHAKDAVVIQLTLHDGYIYYKFE